MPRRGRRHLGYAASRSAIAWMGTGFLALAVIALLYRSRLVRAQLPFLATVKGEWQEDRLIPIECCPRERIEMMAGDAWRDDPDDASAIL